MMEIVLESRKDPCFFKAVAVQFFYKKNFLMEEILKERLSVFYDDEKLLSNSRSGP